MRNASNVPHGITTLAPLGLDGGGWVTGIHIATDGAMVTRNDTIDAHVLPVGATVWRALFKPGVTYPTGDQLFKNPAQRCYDICFAPSNSSILFALCMGKVWKTTDQGLNWTKQTAFNTGAVDTALISTGTPRLGGQHIRCSPTNPLNFGFVHPTLGLYTSTDGGTTITANAVVLAPTTVAGGCIHFVSDTDVWVVSQGRGAYHSTTGVGGTFALVSGGPTACSSISSGGGNVYFVGDGNGGDSQLFLWNGTAFSQPTSVTGYGVSVNPLTTTNVIVMLAGGGVWSSTNTGTNWASSSFVYAKSSDDVPYLGKSNTSYLSLGAIQFSPTVGGRLWVTCGVGVYYIDGPPGTSASKLVSVTKGIRQMLPQDVVISPGGTVLIPTQDKTGFVFSRANATQQANKQIPDNTLALRMGGGMDYARDNESYLAAVYTQGAVGSLSSDAGATWAAIPTIPTFTQAGGGVISFYGGDIAVSNAGNMVWVSSSNQGTGVSTGGVKYTTDGGTTWLNPTFGASVSMTGAMWHSVYYARRRIVQAYKGTAGVFYLFCNGVDGTASAADLACLGMWKSTDSGATFTKIRAAHFISYSADYYYCKLKLNNNVANHAFWVTGALNNYPTAPYANGLYFTPDDWTTTYTLTGWSEPDDLAIGAKATPAQVYQTLYVVGWRGGVYGLYRSTDFDPTAPLSCTWQLQETWLLNRPDNDNVIGADPTTFGRVIVGLAGGGGGVGDYIDTANGT